MADVAGAIEAAVRYLSEHPDEARYTDSPARAVLEKGLRVRVEGQNGEMVVSDMPAAVGGNGEAPSPGWLLRAAVASCAASLIAMEAAREGISLESLAVSVDSESDDRGILGMDAAVPAGPLSMRLVVEAGPIPREIVERGIDRCPTADAVRREVPTTVELD